jgi:3'(2'), 5'-bisphosphate nucleotidase
MRYGGAGYKCLKVIEGEVDSVLLMNLKTSKWDTCAGEAIILAMGGQAISPALEAINYADTECTSNLKGFFMTTDQQTFQHFIEAVKEHKHCQKLPL